MLMQRLRIKWGVLLLLAYMPLLSSCEMTKDKLENLTMERYQTEEFDWDLAITGYAIDLKNGGYISLQSKGVMKDAKGHDVRYFDFNGTAGWGIDNGGVLGAGGQSALPAKLDMTYYDYVEDQFYNLQTELPQQRIYELFKTPYISADWAGTGESEHYQTVEFGIAPQGYIVLWVTGGGQRIEVGHFTALKVEGDWNKMMNFHTFGQQDRKSFRSENLKDNLTAVLDTYPNIMSGKYKLTPDLYASYRVKYPWRFSMSPNVEYLEYFGDFANRERYMVFAPQLAKDNTILKSAPQFMKLYFNHGGQRYRLDLEFYLPSETVRMNEPSLNEVVSAFQALFPSRKVENNEKPVDTADFADMRVNVSDDLGNVNVVLTRNGQSITLNKITWNIKPLTPNAYWPEQKEAKPITLDMLSSLKSTENLRVKVNEVCPKTGFWHCPQLEKQSTLYMRQGDVMPGASYKMHGYDVDNMYWEWVKES